MSVAAHEGERSVLSRRHRLDLDDILTNQTIGDATMSPAGDLAAIVIQRAETAAVERYGWVDGPWNRADVWLVPRRGRLRNITNGVRDGTWHWQPTWSPDGRYLAILTTRVTNNVGIEVWDERAGTLRRVGPPGVDLDAHLEAWGQPMEWVDSTTLLAAFVPAGTIPLYYAYGPNQRIRRDSAWARTEHGAQASVSLLEGGVETPAAARPQGSLALIDVRTGRVTIVAQANIRETVLSPDHRQVALIADDGNDVMGPGEGPRWPEDGSFIRFFMHRRLGLAQLQPAGQVRWIEGLHDPYLSPSGGAWAVDGSKFVVATHSGASQATPLEHVVVDAHGMVGALTPDSSFPRDTPVSPPPAQRSELVLAVESPRTGFALYTSEPADGSLIWTRDTSNGAPHVRMRLNSHLGKVEDDVGQERLIHYRGADGARYAGQVLLPAGYVSGVRYPTIVWPYPGHIVPDSLPRRASGKPHSAFYPMMDPHLWSTRGYVVLQPSIPPSNGDPVVSVAGYIDPAIDSLVAMGVTDSSRLALVGHSHGAILVYGLITMSTRYRAAIAIAGWSDILSYYAAFMASYCYCRADFPNEWVPTGLTQFEASNATTPLSHSLRIGVTPWEDPLRWHRNNPIEHFDRVTTPLMIVKADNDTFYMSDGDIAFQALSRLGKRVRYVRYWGEGHTLSSPANLRDYWSRARVWLDDLLHSSLGSASR